MFQGSRKVVYAAFLVALVLAAVASGCIDPGKPNPTAVPSGSGSPTVSEKVYGTLTLGTAVDEGSFAIETDGAEASIDEASSPLNGFVLAVPPGSFDDTRTFSLAYAPVTGSTFGSGFQPVS